MPEFTSRPGAISTPRRYGGICAEIPVLEWDFEIADRYGRIQADLRRKGKAIPQNDIWIAATASRHGMILITLDRHFAHVEGLPTEFW